MRSSADSRPKADQTQLLAKLIVEVILEKKGLNPVVLDIRGLSSVADFFVIATGTSSRHVQSIATEIEERLGHGKNKILGIEGKMRGDWVLIDCGEVVTHIFNDDIRVRYNLEGLWMDGKRIEYDGMGERYVAGNC